MSDKRPTREQAEAVADNIRQGGVMATELATEEEIGRGVLSGATPILDEAKAEEAEGGGPIADVVKEFDQQTADAEAD